MNKFISIDTTTTDTGSDNSPGTNGRTEPLTQHDNKYQETQVVEPEEVTGVVFSVSIAYDTDQKPMFRRLCGSI
ncbi:MAG: hypothetical protein HZB32_05255 [Nitrospirae bacterium]|nr:hypothetical protein [Nitrospirota bacterium]